MSKLFYPVTPLLLPTLIESRYIRSKTPDKLFYKKKKNSLDCKRIRVMQEINRKTKN